MGHVINNKKKPDKSISHPPTLFV